MFGEFEGIIYNTTLWGVEGDGLFLWRNNRLGCGEGV